jgi:hypothetical protein
MAWLGPKPQFYGNQMSVAADPTVAPVQNIAPPDAFTWAEGGQRLTPDELANRRAIAQSLMKSDYSPVSSVWQGLGRVADNVLGAIDARQLDKQSDAAASRSNAVAQALLGKGGGDVAAQALVDPYLDENTRGLAKMQWERANPKPANNDTINDYNFIAQTLGPEAANNYLRNLGDPMVNMSLGGDRFISGPRSMIPGIIGGGQQGGAQPPPATLPPDFDFDAGGPSQPAAGNFRPSGNPLDPGP